MRHRDCKVDIPLSETVSRWECGSEDEPVERETHTVTDAECGTRAVSQT